MQSITFLKSSLINEGEGKKKVRGDIIQLSPIESWPDTKMLYLFSYLPVHLSVCWASAFPPEYLSGQVFKSSEGKKIKRLSKEVRPTQQLLKIKLISQFILYFSENSLFYISFFSQLFLPFPSSWLNDQAAFCQQLCL